MSTLRWLHLTDLHLGMADQRWLWPNVREAFFSDLAQLHGRSGPLDLVLFTGDLTQTGKPEEFGKLEDFLGAFWDQLAALGSHPQLLAVPGNHDLVRPSADDARVGLLQRWDADVEARFWKDGSPHRALIHE